MDIGATVLHMLMEEQSLDGWARVKNSHPEWGWSAQPTAYLYRVSGTPTTDALRAAGKLEE